MTESLDLVWQFAAHTWQLWGWLAFGIVPFSLLLFAVLDFADWRKYNRRGKQ